MGYQEGKGLGKDLQGRAVPVEAQVRKGRGAIGIVHMTLVDSNVSHSLILIGAYGSEHKNERIITATSDDEKEEAEFKKKLGQWKRGSEANLLFQHVNCNNFR